MALELKRCGLMSNRGYGAGCANAPVSTPGNWPNASPPTAGLGARRGQARAEAGRAFRQLAACAPRLSGGTGTVAGHFQGQRRELLLAPGGARRLAVCPSAGRQYAGRSNCAPRRLPSARLLEACDLSGSLVTVWGSPEALSARCQRVCGRATEHVLAIFPSPRVRALTASCVL